MPKNPKATVEEIEFCYGLMERGLTHAEMIDEYQETTFPPRTDPRHYRVIRRHYLAGTNFFGSIREDPLLTEKRRAHEDELAQELRAFSRSWLPLDLPSFWTWATGVPELSPAEFIGQDICVGESLEAGIVLKHLSPEDPIREGHRSSGKLLRAYRERSRDFYGQLVNEARRSGISLCSRWADRAPAPVLHPEFIGSLFQVAARLVSNGSGISEPEYSRAQYAAEPALSELWFGSSHIIAVGLGDDMDLAEATHRDILSRLPQYRHVDELRELRRKYDGIVRDLEKAIKIRAKQKVFLPGPCEICEAWGGLGRSAVAST